MTAPLIVAHLECAIPPEAIRQLYAAVHRWPERTSSVIAALLETSIAVGAWEDDRLIGFARAVTDHSARAYIEDVAVLPSYRGCGTGEQLLRCLLNELHHINTISLFCQHDLVSWYEQVGFKARLSQTVMHRSRQ